MVDLVTVTTGFKSVFQEAFAGVQPTWSQLAMEVPSETFEEEYGWLGEIPGMREWVGDRHVQQLKQDAYKIRNRDFELTVGVDRNTIDDDRFGIYAPRFRQMGYEAAIHPDRLVYELLMGGFDTECYDRQYFFDTDHPVLDKMGVEQSVSNDGGGAGAHWFLLDTMRPVKPIILQMRKRPEFVTKDRAEDENLFWQKNYLYGVDARYNVGFGYWQTAYGSRQTLDATAYNTARAAMMSFKGDGGRPLGIMPNLLVVGPANEGAAREILQAERNAAGATNIWRGTAQMLVVPWIT